jgi:hypothetical protein
LPTVEERLLAKRTELLKFHLEFTVLTPRRYGHGRNLDENLRRHLRNVGFSAINVKGLISIV